MKLNSNNQVIIEKYDQEKRNLMLIIPGGGYQRTSPRESRPISDKFLKLGFHTAIYEYRHTLLKHPDVISEALEVLEKLKKLEYVDQIFVIGFSAGGHLALHLLEKKPLEIKAGILCYPVVSSDDTIWHEGSFTTLLNDLKEKEEVSLEKHVVEQMPPIFLWHTLKDQSVSVLNSIRLLEKLHEKNISVEAHFYPEGRHGLSLANQDTPFENEDKLIFEKENKHVATWFETLEKWLEDIIC